MAKDENSKSAVVEITKVICRLLLIAGNDMMAICNDERLHHLLTNFYSIPLMLRKGGIGGMVWASVIYEVLTTFSKVVRFAPYKRSKSSFQFKIIMYTGRFSYMCVSRSWTAGLGNMRLLQFPTIEFKYVALYMPL